MKSKSLFWLLATVLLTTALPAQAQQPKKIPRIGYLAATGPDQPNNVAFRRGLLDLGYVEGKNILVEYRSTEGNLDRTPSLVAELLQLKLDIFVSPCTRVMVRSRLEERKGR
jgi:putative ABC transport system substrate-binding protein